MTASLLDELRWRGMFHDATPGLEARLGAQPPISGYTGFDPSGPSLHIGHLVPIFGLLHLQQTGGQPVAVVGGGTGMIGDPSGRSAERNLLDPATLEANVASIGAQLGRLLDFEGPGAARLVNNADWLGGLGLIEFLRDVGKHFSIPYMLAKDSVQSRLERGLSFTEFSYMLLQAADFEHLHRTQGVELQLGGADQWGNITAGLELIRRVSAGEGRPRQAYGLGYPLLLAPSGTKFGKTESGDTVWLDPTRTSPYAFYQHWLNVDDRDVGTYLRWFTLLDRPRISSLEADVATRPEARIPQRTLARDLTARVHGQAAADHVVAVSEAAFAREPVRDPAILATLHADVGGFDFDAGDLTGDVLALTVRRGVFSSNGEARRTIQQGGLSINDRRIERPDEPVPQAIDGDWLVVRVGRKRLLVGRRTDR